MKEAFQILFLLDLNCWSCNDPKSHSPSIWNLDRKVWLQFKTVSEGLYVAVHKALDGQTHSDSNKKKKKINKRLSLFDEEKVELTDWLLQESFHSCSWNRFFFPKQHRCVSSGEKKKQSCRKIFEWILCLLCLLWCNLKLHPIKKNHRFSLKFKDPPPPAVTSCRGRDFLFMTSQSVCLNDYCIFLGNLFLFSTLYSHLQIFDKGDFFF